MARYLAAVLTYIKTIDEQLLERMQRDKDALISSFQDHIRPDRVLSLLLPQRQVKEILFANTEEKEGVIFAFCDSVSFQISVGTE